MNSLVINAECEQVGRSIRAAREKTNWTQQQLAEYAGLGLQTVVRIEQGNPGVSVGNIRKAMYALKMQGPEAEALVQTVADIQEFPLHERHLDSDETQEALEAATKAACDVLDEWLGVQYVEVDGISSNFQGQLKAHLAAMICGRPHARNQMSLARLVYSDDWLRERPVVGAAFGWVIRFTGTDRILDDGRIRALTHEDIDLYVSSDAALNGFRKYIERHGHPDAPVELAPVYLRGDHYTFEPLAAAA